jgi:predicted acetyltransferase
VSIEIRPVAAEELAEFSALPSYVFADTRTAEEVQEQSLLLPEWTHAAFVDGRIATTFGAYPFQVRLNGAPVQMAGVTAVGTYPEFRRRGLLRQVMTQAISDERDRGQSIAILWASYGAIYQRFGYGLASVSRTYLCEPRNLRFNDAAPESSGGVRVMPKDEARPIIEGIYREYRRPRNLMIDRAPQLWDARLRNKDLRCGVYRNSAGEETGYLTFTTKETGRFEQPTMLEPGPDQYMQIFEAFALDPDAERGLWDFVASHDLVDRARWWNVDPSSSAPFFLLEPRDLRAVSGDGIWMRVTDVEAALPQRPYGDEGALTLRIVEDDIADWNIGSYRLETSGRESTVTRTTESPDLTMRPAQLAVLLAGNASATQLTRAGLLEAASDDVLRRADRIFATEYAPWCPDGF